MKWIQSNNESITKSILDLYIDKNKLYAQVFEIININNKKAACEEFTWKNKEKPIERIVIVEGLTFQNNYWQDKVTITKKIIVPICFRINIFP